MLKKMYLILIKILKHKTFNVKATFKSRLRLLKINMKDLNMNARGETIYLFNQITKIVKMIKKEIVKTRVLNLKLLSFLGCLREDLLNPLLSISVIKRKDLNYSQTQLSSTSFFSSGVISGGLFFIGDTFPLCSTSR
jgi:hypothetical protein